MSAAVTNGRVASPAPGVHGKPRPGSRSGSARAKSLRLRIRVRLRKLRIQFEHTRARLGKFKNIFNPNHRHDEPHEQRVDRKRLEVAQSHRYNSFAPERTGCDVKWYVDARDYFWAVSIALDNAKDCIYLADWWLSPELFLRRPPAENQHWRLDNVLKRRAEAGVRIFIIVYKEVEAAITCNSAHTKKSLEDLCPIGSPGHGNIRIMRHPDHDPFTHGSDMTFYWAHHEKFVVIDHKLAFVGGLDLCFGRWDNHQHPLADVHPEGIANEIWPGQDFNNNRVLDFQHVEAWEQNKLDKKKYGRMPWHDIHIGFVGPAVMDVAEHFVGRWNFVKRDKYKRHSRYPWLRLAGVDDDLLGVERPKFPVGGYELHPRHAEHHHQHSHYFSREHAADYPPAPPAPPATPAPPQEPTREGPADVQIVRSSADWSHGIKPTEHSIQNAYRDLIEKAERFVYIENQFFITATGDQQAPIHNTIGASIVAAVARAHKESRAFKVIIVIPAIPGFPGDLREDAANGTRAIIDYQYKSILRGEHSIFGRLKAEGVDRPEDYVHVFNLRSYDRIHTTKALLEREKETGVDYGEVQTAAAVDVMGARGVRQETSSVSSAESDANVPHVAARRKKFEEKPLGGGAVADSIAHCPMGGNQRSVTEEPWDNGEEQEKKNFIQEELYVHAKCCIVDDEIMIVGSANINDRSQLGDHDSEIAAVVRHPPTVKGLRMQLWAEHLGMLPPQPMVPADDDINCLPPNVGAAGTTATTAATTTTDKAQSEPPPPHGEALVDGNPQSGSGPAGAGVHGESPGGTGAGTVSKFTEQTEDTSRLNKKDTTTTGENDRIQNRHIDDPLLSDPLSAELWETWTARATLNTDIFRRLFHCDPDDCIRTWNDYDEFLPNAGVSKVKQPPSNSNNNNPKNSTAGSPSRKGKAAGNGAGEGKSEEEREKEEKTPEGHLYPDALEELGLDGVKRELAKIRGHLVWMPLRFLESEEMAEVGLSVNRFTESIYT